MMNPEKETTMMQGPVSIPEPLAVIAYLARDRGMHDIGIGSGRPIVARLRKRVQETEHRGKRALAWFKRKKKDRVPSEHSVSGVPTGTQIIRNPASREMDTVVGLPEELAIMERHGKRFHLIQGRERNAIEVTHFVERRENGRPDLVEDRTVYVLAPETSVYEARRIGYDLLERTSSHDSGH